MTFIPDRCGGSPGAPRVISWSVDSYSYNSYVCDGCPDCQVGTYTGRLSVSEPNLSKITYDSNEAPQEPYSGPWDAPPKGDT